MTNALRSSLQQIATELASSILDALRSASLEDILSGSGHSGSIAAGVRARPTKKASKAAALPKTVASRRPARSRRLGRRSPSALAAAVDRIVALLATKTRGLRAEQIRDALKLQSKELPRPLADALKAKRITKTGQKRATTYFAGGARPAASAKPVGKPKRKAKPTKAARPSKRSAKRVGKRAAKRVAKRAPKRKGTRNRSGTKPSAGRRTRAAGKRGKTVKKRAARR
jgi:hypothetical protein